MTTNTDNTITAITSTGITTTAYIFFRDAVTAMIPWLVVSVPLILLDLDFGIKAARHRGEAVRFSKAFRGTFGKVVEYFAWVCFASTASLAFGVKWVEWLVLAAVIINEVASVVGNYFETKGIEFSFVNFYRYVLRWGSGKVGETMEKSEAEEIIKPKRDSRGRFIKQK